MAEPHDKLLEAVAQLDKGQRVKKAERSEPTIEVSEYHLVKSGIPDSNIVRPEDLAKSLGQKGHQHEITKKLRYLKQKCKVLPKPLEKPAAERIKRTVGFDETKNELHKWNAVIARNRTAGHLSFPLNHAGKIKDSPTTEFLKRFRLKSDLMKKLEEVDPSISEFPVEEEKKDRKNITMQELILRRQEAAKRRALQSYKEAKAHRTRKIKSKRFHRIQKKDRIKQELKKFEELQRNNPEEALTKLEQLDKSRAEERMSLRHKSTGQWAKNKQIRAKYDKDVRRELAEQLAISKELTQKVQQTDEYGENEEEVEKEKGNPSQRVSWKENQKSSELLKQDPENPWKNTVKTDSEVNEFIQNYRRYWDQKNQEEKDKKALKTDESKSIENGTLSQDKAEKQMSNEANKDNSTTRKNEQSETKEEEKNLINSTSQKTDQAVGIKTDDKKKKAQCTIISEEILDRKIILCNKVTNNASQQPSKRNTKRKCSRNKIACSTSAWDVEELQFDEETTEKRCKKKSKVSQSQSLDEMFDSLEENVQRKTDLKQQKAKEKLEVNRAKRKQEKMKKQERKKTEEENEDDENIPDLEFTNFNPKPVFDQPLDETTSTEIVQRDNLMGVKHSTTNTVQESVSKSNSQKAEIKLDEYLNVKPKYLRTQLPDDVGEEEDALDNNEGERETNINEMICEAFADDATEEFLKEKEEEIKNSQPEIVDDTLPGWGRWSGPNIKQNRRNRRKKQTVLLNVPQAAPRKDENKGKLIIFQDTNEKLKDHLVSELPHPFTTVKDFEASLRAPVSRTFVTENAHLRLIQPAVDTKIGQVIAPMDEDVLVKKQPTVEKLQKRGIDQRSNNKRPPAKNNKKRRK